MIYEFVAVMQIYDILITLVGFGAFMKMASSAFPEINGRP